MKTSNKHIVTLLAGVSMLLIVACGGGEINYAEATVGELEKEIAAKRKAISDIEGEIKRMEVAIVEKDPSYKIKKEEAVKRVVETTTVGRSQFEKYVDFQGNITTKNNYMASSELGGVVTQLTVEEGDYVKRGQLIATTDDKVLVSNMSELQTQLNLAKDVYQRRQRLWEQSIGSELEYVQAANNVEALEKSIATLNTQMAKTKVYAPQSGIVDQLFVRQGEMAGPGAPILKIINTSQLLAVVDIPENYLKSVKKGDYVNVLIPALDIEQQARITDISPTIKTSNRTFEIEVALNNQGNKMKPNLMATVQIKEFAEKDAVVISSSYVMNDGSGDYVYLVAEKNGKTTAHKQTVTVGETFEVSSLITEGLKGGETIITEGARMLANGDPIKVLAAAKK